MSCLIVLFLWFIDICLGMMKVGVLCDEYNVVMEGCLMWWVRMFFGYELNLVYFEWVVCVDVWVVGWGKIV